MPFVSQKRGFFGPYLVQIFIMLFSDLFWIFLLCSLRQVGAAAAVPNCHTVATRIANFIIPSLFLEAGRCLGHGAKLPTWFNPSGALTIFGLFCFPCRQQLLWQLQNEAAWPDVEHNVGEVEGYEKEGEVQDDGHDAKEHDDQLEQLEAGPLTDRGELGQEEARKPNWAENYLFIIL